MTFAAHRTNRPRTGRRGLRALPAIAAMLTAASAAQNAAPEATSTSSAASQAVEEVVVRGRRLGEIEFDLRLYIREFVEEIAAPARTRGYARWRRRLCVGVHNLENTAAQYIVDRISSVALDIGLEAGEPGCRPEVNILFAADANEMAAYMVDAQPHVFRPAGGNAGMDLGLEALDTFVQSDRAVRWWHVSLPVDARTGAAAIELPSTRGLCEGNPLLIRGSSSSLCPPNVAVAGPSRLHSATRDDLRYVIIIVDATRLNGATWQQLADYLAIVSLAQIDPNANPAAFDSILNLFGNPSAYSGLTDWDRSYLRALYSIDLERVPHAQRNEVISRIEKQERTAARSGQELRD